MKLFWTSVSIEECVTSLREKKERCTCGDTGEKISPGGSGRDREDAALPRNANQGQKKLGARKKTAVANTHFRTMRQQIILNYPFITCYSYLRKMIKTASK